MEIGFKFLGHFTGHKAGPVATEYIDHIADGFEDTMRCFVANDSFCACFKLYQRCFAGAAFGGQKAYKAETVGG